jgi:hypothetical protein
MSDSFLLAFFGPGNDLSHDAIVDADDDRVRRLLEPWLVSLRRNDPFTFLPRARDGSTIWYGLARSEPGMRSMRELVASFVGASYTSFRGGSLPLDRDDAVDAAAMSFAEGGVVKFEVWPRGVSGHQRVVREALLQLHHLRLLAPLRDLEALRPTWRVLRDFELALQEEDQAASARLLDELATSHAIGEPNLSFLQIRLLARFERWTDLLALEELPWILSIRHPPAVGSAIIRAIFHERVRPALGDEEDLRRVAREVDASSRALFRADPRPLTIETAITAALVDAVANPPRPAQAERIVAAAAAEGFRVPEEIRSMLGPLAGTGETELQTPADPLAEARTTLWKGDAEAAFHQAAEAPESAERAWILLQAAGAIQSLAAAEAALRAVERLDEGERGFLNAPPMRSLLENLRDLGSGRADLPKTWLEWANRLGTDPSFTSARDVAERGASEWPTSAYDDATLEQLAETLQEVPTLSSRLLVQAVPHLLAAFPVENARAAHIPLYLALLQRIAFDERASPQELAAALTLTEVVLHLGPDAAVYQDLIDLCRLMWDLAASPASADWAIDVCHLLAYYPQPADAAAQGFLQAVLQRLQAWPQVIDPPVRSSLRYVGDVFDVPVEEILPPPAVVERGAEHAWDRLNGKAVAIYSLTSSAAAQATKVLRQLAPECRVETNDDHVCTDRLTALAANADWFVLATQSSKHAATDCVRASRGTRPLLYPSGKGASSILRALEERLTS